MALISTVPPLRSVDSKAELMEAIGVGLLADERVSLTDWSEEGVTVTMTECTKWRITAHRIDED